MTVETREFRSGWRRLWRIDIKTLFIRTFLGQGSRRVPEGIFGGRRGRITSGRGVRELGSVEPGDGGGRQAELQMVGHGLGVAGLRLGATGTLAVLFEVFRA